MKTVAITMMILFIMATGSTAGLIGDFYKNDRYGGSINGYGWKADTAAKKKLVSFKNNEDSISEVSLDIVPLETYDAETAKDVAIAKIEAYDSWIYVGGRQLEGWEIGNANATDGFLVMYSKNLFSRTSGTMKVIVTEKYFVKGGYAYIVTMLTTSNGWYANKNQLLKIANSFRI